MVLYHTEILDEKPEEIPWGNIRVVHLGDIFYEWKIISRTKDKASRPTVVLYNKNFKKYMIKESCRIKNNSKNFENINEYFSMPKKKFNKLTVIKDSGKRNNSREFLWECQCDCGNIIYCSTTDLKKGYIKSCGCTRKDNCSKNLLGKTFGKLTVIERIYNNSNTAPSSRRARWKVKCECGTEFITLSQSLISGGTTSCGCSRRKNLVGQHFGKLTVIKDTKKTKNGSAVWLCECECGNIKEITSKHLRDGSTISCGCLKNSKGEYFINQLLDKNKISYEKQKTFNDCKNPITNYFLYFDFYLPDYNCCIEYDGEQHFNAIDHFGGEERLKHQQTLDSIKTQYCKDNNIKLIRIPYTEIDNIEEILTKELNF